MRVFPAPGATDEFDFAIQPRGHPMDAADEGAWSTSNLPHTQSSHCLQSKTWNKMLGTTSSHCVTTSMVATPSLLEYLFIV